MTFERGKKVEPDFIPAGTPEPRSKDSTDELVSAVDIGQDFTQTAPTQVADPNEQ